MIVYFRFFDIFYRPKYNKNWKKCSAFYPFVKYLSSKIHWFRFRGHLKSLLLVITVMVILSGQRLLTRSQSEHLGVVLDSRLTAASHVNQREKRARAAFYGLTPAGMLAKSLAHADKAYLWQTVVLPVLIFGCGTAALRSADVEQLEIVQAVWRLRLVCHARRTTPPCWMPQVFLKFKRYWEVQSCEHSDLRCAPATVSSKLSRPRWQN